MVNLQQMNRAPGQGVHHSYAHWEAREKQRLWNRAQGDEFAGRGAGIPPVSSLRSCPSSMENFRTSFAVARAQLGLEEGEPVRETAATAALAGAAPGPDSTGLAFCDEALWCFCGALEVHVGEEAEGGEGGAASGAGVVDLVTPEIGFEQGFEFLALQHDRYTSRQ